MMENDRWTKLFEDRRPRYMEFSVNSMNLVLETPDDLRIEIDRMVFGIGTQFEFYDQPAKNVVLGNYMLTDVSVPIIDIALQLRIVQNPNEVISLEIIESRGKSEE